MTHTSESYRNLFAQLTIKIIVHRWSSARSRNALGIRLGDPFEKFATVYSTTYSNVESHVAPATRPHERGFNEAAIPGPTRVYRTHERQSSKLKWAIMHRVFIVVVLLIFIQSCAN